MAWIWALETSQSLSYTRIHTNCFLFIVSCLKPCQSYWSCVPVVQKHELFPVWNRINRANRVWLSFRHTNRFLSETAFTVVIACACRSDTRTVFCLKPRQSYWSCVPVVQTHELFPVGISWQLSVPPTNKYFRSGVVLTLSYIRWEQTRVLLKLLNI